MFPRWVGEIWLAGPGFSYDDDNDVKAYKRGYGENELKAIGSVAFSARWCATSPLNRILEESI